jgi:hypothetical protein
MNPAIKDEHELERHLDDLVDLTTTMSAESAALGYNVFADYFATIAFQVGKSLNGARADEYGNK